MRFHTPPPAIDLVARVPELSAYRRTATRLHPRRGDVTASLSHIGGVLLWPAGEPWVTCTAPYEAEHDIPMPPEAVERLRRSGPNPVTSVIGLVGSGASAEEIGAAMRQAAEASSAQLREVAGMLGNPPGGLEMDPARGIATVTSPEPHEPPNPMVAVAQLLAADVPDLWCPPGTDMLQVLWCPCIHDRTGGPEIALRWRRADDPALAPMVEPPPAYVGWDDFVPVGCRINPERIDEYPAADDLPSAVSAAIDALLPPVGPSTDHELVYGYSLSIAPGWSVGGWPKWNLTGRFVRPCPECDGETELLLTIASSEFGGGTEPRWRPVEEREIEWRDPRFRELREPTGVVVGRHGSLRIFVCKRCPGTPHWYDLQ